MNIEIEDVCPAKPKFEVGDVVTIPEASPGKTYVIKEAIDFGPSTGIVYEMFAPDNTERIIQFAESALEFQYHDVSWEYHLTEGTRIYNDLPDWRGELYNMYACYADIATHGAINKSVAKEYENCTLPPSRMFHVMRSHDIYNRIFDVIVNNLAERRLSNREFMCKRLNVDDDELTQISGSVMDKLNAMNLEDMNPENLKKASKRNPGFTETESRFVALIDILDVSKKKFKDHYPVTMTALQIMDAIKEAYNHAHRQGELKIQKDKNPEKGENLDAPHKGKRKYQGESRKYGLTIEFWYNLDYDFIETAYPLRMNNNAKKH